MSKYQVYVSFEREKTAATHYLSITDLTLQVVIPDVKTTSTCGSIAGAQVEVAHFLEAQYPDRVVERVSIHKL
jgi:hypothetical protein